MELAAPARLAPAPDARSFRNALGRLATGVAFVTAAPDGEPAGMIVNSLAPAGDHWIVVGRVDDLRIAPINEPLVFFAGAFGTLQQAS